MGFFLAGLAATTLGKSGLTLDHEGLKILQNYLYRFDQALGSFVQVMAERGALAGRSSLLRTNLVESRMEREAMAEATARIVTVSAEISGVGDLLRSMV